MGFCTHGKKEAGKVNDSSWQKMLLAVFFICFVCLFATGAERLIADEEHPSAPISGKVFAACIGCSHSSQTEAEKHLRRDHEPGRREECCAEDSDGHVSPAAAISCDANGNILSCRSYLRAVYQAFALGDGFV